MLLTLICGGRIEGNCAIGRRNSATSPNKTVAMAITIALDHEYFIGGTLVPVLSFGLVFYAACVWFAWRWRARWRYGPLELILRQLSSGSPVAPWGGAP